MDTEKTFFFLLICSSLLTRIHCFIDIDPAENVNKSTSQEGFYTLTMDENNHSFNESVPVPIFTMKMKDCSGVTARFLDQHTFQFEIKDCTFYAKQSFDYENENQRQYKIYVIDTEENSSNIVLKINNIDDENPVLTCPSCEFKENTDYTADNTPCKYTLYDPDGWLSKIKITVQAGEAHEDTVFEVAKLNVGDTTYTATVPMYPINQLDYENITFYSFSILAVDTGNNSDTKSTTVKVIDQRDTYPTWNKPLNFAEFEEESAQTFIVSALDGDTGIKSPIIYNKIKEDDPKANYISINKTSGQIDVKPIDRDKDDITTYNFSINACVTDTPNWCRDQDVSFYIIDIDDNPPLILANNFTNGTIQEFEKNDPNKSIELSFLENYAGNFNFTSFIKDIDTGSNAEFALQLKKSGDFDYTVAYVVVPSAGYRNGDFRIVVRNSTYLDYENPTHDWRNHQFYLTSVGTNDPTKTDKMFVQISLIDYNDEIPKFDENSYSTSMNETVTTGYKVLQAHATDRDAEDKILTMEIIGSYAQERLRIDSDGNIFVNLHDNYFDYDILNSIFFQVRATDKVNHTATVPVTITLLDVNNKAPTIEPVLPIIVEENQINGTRLNVTIKASDPDTTANLTADIDWDNSYATKNFVKLNMTDKDILEKVKFLETQVDPPDGAKEINIYLVVINSNDAKPDKPDFETFDSLYLSLVVTDTMTDSDFMDKNQTTATVLISIKDINDNPPEFTNNTKNENRTVEELAAAGTSAGSIEAYDLDVGSNISYICTAEDPNFDWVILDQKQGTFTVKSDRLIDADTKKTFYFNYTCVAFDGLFNSTELQVKFYILDKNNKKPEIHLNDTVTVVEKSEKDTVVQKIGTSDQDRDIPFHTVHCKIIEDEKNSKTADCADEFFVNDKNVIIVKNGGKHIDRDGGRPTFSCFLQCSDNINNERFQGSLNTDKSFTIELLDINDNSPVQITKELSCLESLEKDGSVGFIFASDVDKWENGSISFIINSVKNDDTGEDIASFFDCRKIDIALNKTTKKTELITTQALKGKYGQYTVDMLLKDQSIEPLSTPIKIKLTIEKYIFAPPSILIPHANDKFLLLSSQTVNAPLALFKESGNMENFKAKDGATDDCSKWDVTFRVENSENLGNIFTTKYVGACESQLQITNKFDPDTNLNIIYNLNVTVWLNSTDEFSPSPSGAIYKDSVKIQVTFLNNSQEPYFENDDPWTFDFYEKSENETQQLLQNATYAIDNGLKILYYLDGDKTVDETFKVNESDGEISLKKELIYDEDNMHEFKIIASNDTNHKNSLPNGSLNVTVNVKSINWRAPIFNSSSFFGAVMPTFQSGFSITNITAYDPDAVDKGKLSYTISSEIKKSGTGLDNVPAQAFTISSNNDVGTIELKFTVESSMSGFFKFSVTVSDADDGRGTGPHSVTTETTIFIITTDNTVDFRFLNPLNDLQKHQNAMLKIVEKWAGHTPFIQNIDTTVIDNQANSVARLYFIDVNTTTLLTSKDILRIVADLNVFTSMANQLKSEESLYLSSFLSHGASVDTEAILKKWLTGVSVGLGLICFVLLITLIWKTKQLKRRISNLTTKKFGSQESGLNRLGVAAPTTNKHTIEGSNPVYKTDEIKKPKDMSDFETHSIRSGDSDLIGVENNPEFDHNFNDIDDNRTTYL